MPSLKKRLLNARLIPKAVVGGAIGSVVGFLFAGLFQEMSTIHVLFNDKFTWFVLAVGSAYVALLMGSSHEWSLPAKSPFGCQVTLRTKHPIPTIGEPFRIHEYPSLRFSVTGVSVFRGILSVRASDGFEYKVQLEDINRWRANAPMVSVRRRAN